MVEKARRSPVTSDDRGNPTPQWEVFVRDDEDAPMKHVGSVAAASATEAHEHASRLFGWYAVDVWLCPAEDVERFSTRVLAPETDAAVTDDGDADREREDEDGDRDEPRVYEETEGTPRVRDA